MEVHPTGTPEIRNRAPKWGKLIGVLPPAPLEGVSLPFAMGCW